MYQFQYNITSRQINHSNLTISHSRPLNLSSLADVYNLAEEEDSIPSSSCPDTQASTCPNKGTRTIQSWARRQVTGRQHQGNMRRGGSEREDRISSD